MSDLERLQKRLEREKAARKSAENIAETKTRQLFENNRELSSLGESIKNRSIQLQETLGYLTAIIDNMADGLLVVDTSGRIKRVNQAFIDMFGLDQKDFTNQACHEIFDHHLLEFIEKVQAFKSADPIRMDIPMPEHKTGRAVASPIYAGQTQDTGSTDLIGSVIIIRDFTQEKEIDRVKTEFISNVSHELRTPLTSILGFTKIIKKKLDKTLLPALDGNSNPKISKAIGQVKGNIDIIIAEGERLTNLINGVLDIAKMEAGKVDWHLEPLGVPTLIERAVAATQSLFEHSPAKLEIDIDHNLPEINADQDRMIQVLVNLISNANKFTEQGTVTCRATSNGQETIISVIDTGVGIAPEELGQVFEKFKQVGDTLTDKPKGTGLGLPICKQIVEHHGGRIWVESTVGEGSVFSFSLPVAVKDVPDSTNTRHMNAFLRQVQGQVQLDKVAIGSAQKLVLVVDDEPNIREYLRQELEGAGYQVREAENGLDAVTQAKQLMPDLIILDVMMPMMNGFDAAAVLKNDPQTMKIPIVILSIIEDLERGYRIGINRYLKKPIEADVLLDEVANLVAQKGSQKMVLLVNQDPQAIASLTQTLLSAGDTQVEVSDGNHCIDKAIQIHPDTIIFDTSIPGYQAIETTLRKTPGFEDVSFILLGEGENLTL